MRSSLALALVGALAPFGAAEAGVLPFTPIVERLDNGLTVMMVPRDSPGLVAYFSLVRVGSRDEAEPGVSGFAHFFEHMMFRGTDAWPPDRVQAFLKRAGADQNGFTTDDFTCYTYFGRADVLGELVEMEADRFKHLKYTEAAFKTESQAVLGEYNKSASNPMLVLEERLREKVFTRHTYGHTTLGYLKDIEAMPTKYEYSREFFGRFYTPDNTTLIVVGDFAPATLMELVRRHYADWKGKRATSKVVPEPPQKAELRGSIEWKTPTLPLLSLAYRTPEARFGTKETAAYNVLFELLFGQASAAYRELVLETQLVAELMDDGWNHRDPYLFHAIARVKDPASIPAVEARMLKAVDELAAGKLDERLLADVKSRVRYSLLLGLDTPDRVATTLAFFLGPTGEVDAIERLLTSIEALTPADVASYAKKVLEKRARSVFVLAPGGAK